ncbi:hypothetical protein, partial [Ralstonia pickettii]|uniref:hypothetical protein n=1 Tax=Ralstonia pickettii TaxID=329 RepID=UPI001C7213B4
MCTTVGDARAAGFRLGPIGCLAGQRHVDRRTFASLTAPARFRQCESCPTGRSAHATTGARSGTHEPTRGA